VIEYVNLPLLGQASAPHQIVAEASEEGFTPAIMGLWYFRLLQDAAPLVIESLNLIADSDGPVVFHCAAGKDRTGLVAASLLAIIGASNDVIVEDYALTQQVMPKIMKRIAASQQGVDPELLANAGSLLRADHDSMRTFLQLIDQEYGSLRAALAHFGLSEDTSSALQRKYVTPSQ
jgi:protein-tyrosine phosphatase